MALDGGWLLVNPALCAMFDHAEDELRRLTWQELTHPDDLAADLALVRRAIVPSEVGHIVQQHAPQPAQQLGFRDAVELLEVSLGL